MLLFDKLQLFLQTLVALKLVALTLVIACWAWAGLIMKLPEQRRVFVE